MSFFKNAGKKFGEGAENKLRLFLLCMKQVAVAMFVQNIQKKV